MEKRNIWLVAAAACGFILLATIGGFVTARHMNKTADEQAMSAGRPGDAKPNLLQEQQTDKSARGPSTTGSNPSSSVPPASR
jgi:hypothetical protein